ncbi:MAG: glycine cleavage system protein GcvH [Hyphomicrobiales bacterium]|nr:glycine cleavage system protein GcvH [Hyphomicrobiales bacterium]MDE2115752.1 glycine cleavage system protein GcvH [Hyphomicrobiales bacterium]
MSQTLYTKDHEYIRVEGDIGTIGITDHAQNQLGDVVFVELPSKGRMLKKGSEAAVVESVKAASDIYAAASGEVTEVNAALEATPGMVNEDAIGSGWFFKIRLTQPDELKGLMDEAAYEAYLKTAG